MAITLSNTGISSSAVIQAAEISQSIDAFTGVVAYDIHQSGSFNATGSIALSGSLFLPDNTHMGIGVTPSVTPGIKLHLKSNDSSNDPIVLLEGYDDIDSAHVSYKSPKVQWNFGLLGGSNGTFALVNSTTNQLPIYVDYSSSNSAMTFRNDNGTEIAQRVGINWDYNDLDAATTTHHLNISGSVTSSVGFYGELFGTSSTAISSSHAINADAAISSSHAINANTASLAITSLTASYVESASHAINTDTASTAVSSSYSVTASYVDSISGLWFDGSSYISSSVDISGSSFLGEDAAMESFHATGVNGLFTGSTFNGTTFSGSYISASDATNATIIAPNFITLDDSTESFIMNKNTDGILSIGIGGVLHANAAISISSSTTPSLQIVEIQNGPLWLSNRSIPSGDIYQIKGKDTGYLEWDMALSGNALASATTNLWSMDFSTILYPLTTASPSGTLVVKTCITVYKQIGLGITNNISGYYEISTAKILNSGVMNTYNMSSGTGFQDVEVTSTSMAFVTPQYSNPNTNTLNFQLDLTAGSNMAYQGITTFKWSDF